LNNSLFKPLKIGSVALRGNLFMAPVAGYSDIAFRTLCSKMGSYLNFSEMVSCEALHRGNEKTEDLMKSSSEESPFFIQFFTSNTVNIPAAMKALVKTSVSGVDLNCGCPVPKVTKTGAGSSLLKKPEKIYDIVKAMKEYTNLPVTFKIRSGWDFNSINFMETAQAGIEAGAAMVSLHSRTRSQGYTGKADWSHLKQLKEMSPIPVCGSGDLMTPELAEKMLKETGCDALMFARGIMGNPFLFRQTESILKTGFYNKTDSAEKRKAAEEHLNLAFTYLPEKKAVKDMRKHMASYFKGIPGAASFRNAIVKCESHEEYKNMLQSFQSDY